MKTPLTRYGLALVLLLTTLPTTAAGGRSWVGFNLGLVSGDVDLPCTVPGSDCSEGGIYPSFGANLTFAGKGAFRLRGVVAGENTRERPHEIAALIGAKLSRSWYGLVGAGRIFNPDDNFEGHASGVAWELVYAPPTQSSAGFEFSILGSSGSDVDYGGFSLGLRFGKLR